MIKFVQKRDGRIVPFEKEKITKAIEKAGIATHEFGVETANYLTNIVVNELIDEEEPLNIEVIQNKIEEVLMRKGFFQTAKAFIIYREKRRELRELRKHLNIPELFDQYIGEETWEVHENANIDYSIQGLKAYITGKAEEIYWLEKVYPKKIADYHRDGFVHIHNLSSLTAYCVGWDLEDLIKRGFGGVPGKPYSTPAKHFSSILGQMMNFLFTLQNEAAGAVAFSSFDTLLAPFVYFDNLSYKEVKQQIQEFVYNMNQTMRTGGQSPFSNITVDLTPHPLLKDKPVVIGGRSIKEYTYGMFQKEMDIINKALFEVFIEGDGHGRPFTFPIPTINISKDFDWNNPVLEPVWAATAKYGTPYFANYIRSDLRPEDARSMCCRLRLETRELKNKGGGLFGANPLTGSVGVITINLP
ncbi:ribonucleoside triphosphate reductase, partial [Caldisericum exile]